MADEAVITRLYGDNGDKMEFTVTSGTAIPKGSIMKMTDPKTAIINSGAGDILCGIADFEKSATDGLTTMTIVTNCEAKLKVVAGGSAVLGSDVRISATENQIDTLTSLDGETGKKLGKSLETGAAGETVLVRVHTLS